MNEIKIFSNSKFGDLRVALLDGKEMFCLSDVCKAVDLKNPRQVKARLEERGVITVDTPIKNQFGAEVMQPMLFVNEPNLYRCIFQSRKAEALQFQDWVFEVVLPQIRQTGGYIPISKDDDAQTIMEKAAGIVQRTVQCIREKLFYCDNVLLSPSCYTMTQIAKDLSMTVFELEHRLHDLGIIYRSPSGPFMLYAKHLGKGYEAYRTRHGDVHGSGFGWTSTYLVWTEKGREFVHKNLTA